MSGSNASNLPVTIKVEGLPEAEAAFNRVQQAGQKAMQEVERAAGGASQTTDRLRTALGALGSAGLGGGFDAATTAIGGFLDKVDAAAAAAESLSAKGIVLSRTLATIGGLVGLPVLLQSVGLGISAAGTAALTSSEASDDWRQTMERLDPVLAAVAAKAREAAAAAKAVSDALAGVEEALGRQFETRSATFTALQEMPRKLAEAEAVVAAAQARLAQANERGGLSPERIAFLEGRVTTAQQRVQALRDEEAKLKRDLDELNNRIQTDYPQRVQNIEQQVGRPAAQPGKPENRPAGGAAPAMPDRDIGAMIARSPVVQATQALDAYNQQVNLANAGLDRASGVLAEYARTQGTLQAALDNGVISQEQFASEVERTSTALSRQIEDATKATERGVDVGRQLGLTFSSAFEDAVSKGKSFREILKGIEADIAKIIIRKAVTEPLGNAVSDAVKGFNFGDAFSSIFGGARADGGPVDANRAYLVGEKRPEIFVPNTGGTILPNAAMGGQTIHFAPTYAIDARGADPSMMPRIRQEMVLIARASVEQLKASISRGGADAKLVGRR